MRSFEQKGEFSIVQWNIIHPWCEVCSLFAPAEFEEVTVQYRTTPPQKKQKKKTPEPKKLKTPESKKAKKTPEVIVFPLLFIV